MRDYDQSRDYKVKERLDWAARRKITLEEDMWYCLVGMFDVSIPVIYGEGAQHARKRLLEEIRKEYNGTGLVGLGEAG